MSQCWTFFIYNIDYYRSPVAAMSKDTSSFLVESESSFLRFFYFFFWNRRCSTPRRSYSSWKSFRQWHSLRDGSEVDTKKKPRVESLSKVRISGGNYNVVVFYFSIVDMFFIFIFLGGRWGRNLLKGFWCFVYWFGLVIWFFFPSNFGFHFLSHLAPAGGIHAGNDQLRLAWRR